MSTARPQSFPTMGDGTHAEWNEPYPRWPSVEVESTVLEDSTGIIWLEVRNSQGYTLVSLSPSLAREVGLSLITHAARLESE